MGDVKTLNFDGLVKNRNSIEYVIPAKAGIQLFQGVLGPGFHRGDDSKDFLQDHQEQPLQKLYPVNIVFANPDKINPVPHGIGLMLRLIFYALPQAGHKPALAVSGCAQQSR